MAALHQEKLRNSSESLLNKTIYYTEQIYLTQIERFKIWKIVFSTKLKGVMSIIAFQF